MGAWASWWQDDSPDILVHWQTGNVPAGEHNKGQTAGHHEGQSGRPDGQEGRLLASQLHFLQAQVQLLQPAPAAAL